MEAILNILVSLCPSCDNLSFGNIVDPRLNCSSTNHNSACFTASVIYSSPDGQSTASTLTSALQTWLLTQENPTLMIGGNYTFALNRQCPTVYNSTTEQACLNLAPATPPPLDTTLIPTSPLLDTTLTPTTSLLLDTTQLPLSTDSTFLITIVFFAGLITGIILMILAIELCAW